jgi:hypothetical protein
MTLEEYYRTRYANPDVWGTEGAYYNGMFNRGGDGAEDIDPIGTIGVNLNGTDYTRTGTADNSRFDAFGGGYQYDPTYGWVVPSSVASAYGDSHDDSMNYFLAALGGVAAPYAASIGLVGPGAGVVGAQGSAFPSVGMELGSAGLTGSGAIGGAGNILNGMDLSQYMTNFDTGSGFADLTMNTVGPGEWEMAQEFMRNYPGNMGTVDFGGAASGFTETGASQAIDGSMQTLYDQFANAGVPGYDAALTSGVAAGGAAGSSLANMGSSIPSWLQNLMPSGSSLTNTLLGKVLPSALGYLGADKQADSYRDMMNQYFSLGAPYRSLLQQSYQPGFDIGKEPGFQNAMDTTMNTYMRAASAGNAQGVAGGNPFNNPGAFMESQKYLAGNLALPYLQNYRSGLSSSGQLGLGPAAQFGGNSIQSQGGVYDAIGYGLGEVFNPKPDYMKQFAQMFQPKLGTGGGLV